MAEPWPYEAIRIEVTVDEGNVTSRLRTNPAYDAFKDGLPLPSDATFQYRNRFKEMRDRNPDMTDSQVHHTVLLRWWQELRAQEEEQQI